jgi:flavoprotein
MGGGQRIRRAFGQQVLAAVNRGWPYGGSQGAAEGGAGGVAAGAVCGRVWRRACARIAHADLRFVQRLGHVRNRDFGGRTVLRHLQVAELTGHPVRTNFKDPDAPDVLPPADAFAAVPATFNTINKWAAGISDTLALGLLNEATGLGRPIVTVPWLNVALARHPAFGRSISTLRDCGITVILDPRYLPDDDHPGQVEFPWDELRAELARMRTALADGK